MKPDGIFQFAMENTSRAVPYHTEDRQWDARFNVQSDEDLGHLVNAVRADFERGRLKYVLISGVEIGTRPFQDDYLIRHVHGSAERDNNRFQS